MLYPSKELVLKQNWKVEGEEKDGRCGPVDIPLAQHSPSPGKTGHVSPSLHHSTGEARKSEICSVMFYAFGFLRGSSPSSQINHTWMLIFIY